MNHRILVGISALALLSPTIILSATPALAATADHVVINEAYVNGGSSGATYKNKYVELYNPTNAEVSVAGWSLQYRSYNSTATASVAALTGTIPAKGYYLIEGNANAANGADWAASVTPDAVTTTSWAGNANGGQLILADTTTAQNPAAGSVVSSSDNIVDLLGYTKATSYETTVESSAGSVTTAFARSNGVDTDDNEADFSPATSFTPTNSVGVTYGSAPVVPPVAKTISEIQGTGSASPLISTSVTTTGFVTARYDTGGYNGYLIESAGGGTTVDDSSDGLFVYSSATVGSVAIGDYVQVSGTVSEYNGLTELTVAAGDLAKPDATGLTPPVPAAVSWPTTDGAREALESMLIQPQGDFTVTNTYDTNYYGSVGLAAGTTQLITPSEVARPGTDAYQAVAADNAARAVVLDDGASINFNSAANKAIPLPYLSLTTPVRVGAAVSFTRPVAVDYRNGDWTLQPTQQLTSANADSVQPATFANTRTAAPAAVGGRIKIATFNVLNYFPTTGADAEALGATCSYYDDREGNHISVNTCTGGPAVRGAATATSLARQQAKIVAAINALDADVVSLEEIENSTIAGAARDSAVATLVTALNTAAGLTRWAYAPSPASVPSGEDVIRTAFIYNPDTVEPAGDSVISTDAAFTKARYPLAQPFQPKGEPANVFVAIVNHFKSKGSCPTAGDANADSGDGQGCWNALRVSEAKALVSFSDQVQAGAATDKVFLMGDFNSYSQEDPLQELSAAGYIDQGSKTGKYTYSFDGQSGSLDHVFASAAADKLVSGSDVWNINSGESIALEYSRYNYNALNLYDETPYRSSDHDPLIVGYAPATAPIASPTPTPTPAPSATPSPTPTPSATPSPGPAQTSVTLRLSRSRAAYGTTVRAVATVDGASTGTVRFSYDTTNVDIAVTAGTATLTLPNSLGVGAHRISAAYVATSAAAASTAAAQTLTITKAKLTVVALSGNWRVARGGQLRFTVHTKPLGTRLWATGTIVTTVNGHRVDVDGLTASERGSTTISVSAKAFKKLSSGHRYRLTSSLIASPQVTSTVVKQGWVRIR